MVYDLRIWRDHRVVPESPCAQTQIGILAIHEILGAEPAQPAPK